MTDASGTGARDWSRRAAAAGRGVAAARAVAADTSVAADPARQAAYDTLMAVATRNAYANLVLPKLLSASGITGRDAALATELGYGTLRARGTLDEIVRRCSSRDLDQIEAAVLTLLRLGAYQLLRTRIPAHAAVASTVDLARATGNARSAGFVNAVLRKVAAADYETWCGRIAGQASPLGRLAIRYSHPGWIVAAFADALAADQPAADHLAADHAAADHTAPDNTGPDRAATELEQALAADDDRPATHLIAWPGRTDRDQLAVESGGEPGPYSPYAVRLIRGGEPAALEAVRQHHAAVQDEGSQLCALALVQLDLDGRDARWLDMCAGPGGKAALLAALAGSRDASVTALELHPHRAELIKSQTRGWPVDIVVADAREYAPEAPFDRVLLDAPCTGLGALRRRPEARWRRNEADLDQLVQLQSELLDAAVALVRPGGVIGYVTCSPHLSETREQIDALLARRDDVTLLDARPAFPGSVTEHSGAETVQLWPHRHGTDAMFFAALRREAGARAT